MYYLALLPSYSIHDLENREGVAQACMGLNLVSLAGT